METPENPRHQMVDAALASQPQAVVEVTIRLWERFAPELISIIGEEGFKPLYARSVRLASVHHPWLAHDAASAEGAGRFVPLRAKLQAQELAQARQASQALFNTFLDVLASLIGEALTTHLLYSVWRQESSETPPKDFSR